MEPERVRIVAVELAERAISFRLPFRYGNTVLWAAPEIHIRCRVEFPDGSTEGYSAELAAPKWFDKNPALSNEQNFEQLRDATEAAAAAALAGASAETPALLSKRIMAGEGTHRRLPLGNGLIDAYGVSLIDRAVVDAVCRHRALPLIDVLRGNLLGIDWSTTAPDLATPAADFLAGLGTREQMAVRHTVGFIDPLWSADVIDRPDSFPVALEEIISADGVRYFKIKLSGDATADIARLAAIATLLDQRGGDYRATLDGNEQYTSPEVLMEFMRLAGSTAGLDSLWQRTLFVEQPLARSAAFDAGIAACNGLKPIIIDESDDTADAALRARSAGYSGTSVKTCKGFYKSLLNVARARSWGPPFLVSAEDLSVQAGIALAQNLALWSCLGFEHTERNGHYYGRGLAALPPDEREALFTDHPDLYAVSALGPRLRIAEGDLALSTVNRAHGYGAAFIPDRSDLHLLQSQS